MGQREGDIADRFIMSYVYMEYPDTTYSVRDFHGCFQGFLAFTLTFGFGFSLWFWLWF